MLAVAFGSIAFVTYAVSFWIPPYVLRTFYSGPTDAALILTGGTAAEEVSTIFGWSAALASAIGVILGGYVSDVLRQRYAAGRLYVNMAAIILPIPAIIFLFTTESLAGFYLAAPYVALCSALWVGAAVLAFGHGISPVRQRRATTRIGEGLARCAPPRCCDVVVGRRCAGHGVLPA